MDRGAWQATNHGVKKKKNQTLLMVVAQLVKNLPAMREIWVGSLGWEDPLEKRTATYSNILAWRIPWVKEPGRLQPMGSQSWHDWVTVTSLNWVTEHKHTHAILWWGTFRTKEITWFSVSPKSLSTESEIEPNVLKLYCFPNFFILLIDLSTQTNIAKVCMSWCLGPKNSGNDGANNKQSTMRLYSSN